MATAAKKTTVSVPTPIAKARGRQRLSEAERTARMEFLKNETKEAKFERLCIPRMVKALKAIKAVGALATYKPTEAQITLIMTAFGESCAAVQNRMEGTRKESITFTLHK